MMRAAHFVSVGMTMLRVDSIATLGNLEMMTNSDRLICHRPPTCVRVPVEGLSGTLRDFLGMVYWIRLCEKLGL